MDPHEAFSRAERLWFGERREEAEPRLRQVAQTGHANEASLLGCLLDDAGRKEEAVRWHRRAAARGDREAAEAAARLAETLPN